MSVLHRANETQPQAVKDGSIKAEKRKTDFYETYREGTFRSLATLARLHHQPYNAEQPEPFIDWVEEALKKKVILGRNGEYGVKMYDQDDGDYRFKEAGEKEEVGSVKQEARSCLVRHRFSINQP